KAIRRIRPRPFVTSFPLAMTASVAALRDNRDRHFEVDAVLALADFERFAFVMSVLEHYSEHECSLLLGCSPRQIREAQSRAFGKLLKSPLTTVAGKSPSETIDALVG